MTNVLANQLDKTILDKLTILDVRTAEEYGEGNVPGSTNIPIDVIISSDNLNLDKSKALLVYCESGARSQIACQVLDQQGYQTYNLLGGYTAWLAQKR